MCSARVMKRISARSTLIGVDLGGTNVRAGLVKNGKIIKIATQPVRAHGTSDEVLEDLCAVIDAVAAKVKFDGIGVGAPSIIEKGVILETTNIAAWKNIPLQKKLSKHYQTSVALNNDANCFALGEQAYGQARKAENFVGLILGTGLGTGIISRGRLHSGMQCAAGEFGLIPYQNSVLEHYASGQFFRRYETDGVEIQRRVENGEPEAQEILNAYGKHLAHAIQLILYSVAPEMIVLGGSVSRSYPYFRRSLEEGLQSFSYISLLKSLKIKISKVKNVSILGAARLLIDEQL